MIRFIKTVIDFIWWIFAKDFEGERWHFSIKTAWHLAKTLKR